MRTNSMSAWGMQSYPLSLKTNSGCWFTLYVYVIGEKLNRIPKLKLYLNWAIEANAVLWRFSFNLLRKVEIIAPLWGSAPVLG